ncbi:MAG: class I SAM-dependent methyltransferase, partial [Dehalococcoidia bacterium]|nr:class I SAM-dependent methyltransferase [Dehalococcoidia bacterium]
FAMAGFEVVGLDPSPIFVAEARRYAAEVGILVDFVEGDMRSLTYDREFDAVLNLFTAFGYFDTDADDMAVLRGVARALKPGGVFCQEMAYRETILRHYQSSAVTQRQDGSFELELRAFDQRTSRNYSRSVLIHPDGRRDEGTFTLRLYTLTELVAMYEAAGMTVHAYYGDFDGRPLTMDSRLLLIGRKPEGGPPPAAR